jgi:hypothetical protein
VAFADLVAAADRAVRGNLGGVVVYRSTFGPPLEVSGVFDELYLLAQGDAAAGVEAAGPAVFLRLEDLPLDPEDDDPIIEIASRSYRVVERRPDGIGGIVLALRLIA